MLVNCIVCNTGFNSAGTEGDNQPYGGTTFVTEGQYGSTVFDPMDGSFLEINVCDSCLVTASKREQVLTAQTTRNLYVPIKMKNKHTITSIVGRIRTGDYAPVLWNANIPPLHDEKFVISDSEELKSLWDRIDSNWSLDELISMIELANDVEVSRADGNG